MRRRPGGGTLTPPTASPPCRPGRCGRFRGMRLLMVAPPGAGKGTQAKQLAEHYGIAHLASGDLLRQEVAAGTEIGKAAAAYLRRGDLVPGDLLLKMLTIRVLAAPADPSSVP